MRKKQEKPSYAKAYLARMRTNLNFLEIEDFSQFDMSQDAYYVRISITVPVEKWAEAEVNRPF